MAAATPALTVDKMHKSFGQLEVLKGISLTANDGDVISILGSSGSGKSTFLRCINLLETPDEGVVTVAGETIKMRRRRDGRAEPADRRQVDRIRSELGMVFQSFNLWSHLTVLENVRIALQRRRGGSFDFWRSKRVLHALDERALALIADVGLAPYADALATELPYGRKRALEIATTLALDPTMLLLDEPTSGMGHEDIARISALIKSVAATRTVLMVEHNLSVVADLCDRITVLTRGQVIAEGDYATVSADPAVREAYLGTGDD